MAAGGNIYKVLFFLQSVAFILFLLSFSQMQTLLPNHITSRHGTNTSDDCVCKQQVVRTGQAECEKASGKVPETGSIIADQPVRVPDEQITEREPSTNDSSAVQTAKTPDEPLSSNTSHTLDVQDLSIRGPLTNCSIDDIKKRPGVVLLTTANLAFLDVAINMLLSIKKTGVCVNTTFIAEDKTVYEQMAKRAKDDPTLNVLLTDSGEMDAVEHPRGDRSQYYGLMNKRQAYILRLLKQGYEVLFSDADTFWFRDPFPFFKGDFDISLIDSANPFGVRTSRSNFCAGFIYFKTTSATLQLVKSWVDSLEGHRKRGSYPTDQGVLNTLLNHDKPVHINVKPLDTDIFPWGPKFYDLLAKKANYPTVMMHAASIRGHKDKVTKFKSSNMWLIGKSTEELVAEKL